MLWCPSSLTVGVVQRAVGDHIQSLPARHSEAEGKLWSFVSSFTENKMDGDKLQKLYAKLKANKAAPSGECLPSLQARLHEHCQPLLAAAFSSV